MDCIFCAIAAGEVPAAVIAESDGAVAFRDREGMAPTHVLVVPRKHIASVDDLGPEDGPLAAELLRLCSEVARIEGVHETGYRVVTNAGPEAGQSVFHLHLHVLGGRQLTRMG